MNHSFLIHSSTDGQLGYFQHLANEQNKLMSKTEPEGWTQETVWQLPEERGEGWNDGKKRKGVVREHLWMTMNMDDGVGMDCGSESESGWRKTKGRKLEQL